MMTHDEMTGVIATEACERLQAAAILYENGQLYWPDLVKDEAKSASRIARLEIAG